ncbi:MAG: DUF5683 domain-containing protein [Bacteroidetes bacterium]|nr:DUF5683 domain-containing protein [Bacteroidota bacterium]
MSERKYNLKYNYFYLVLFIFIFTFSITEESYAQQQSYADSMKMATHSPRKASLYSMVLPGLGQAYNQQYWKVPVLYAGIATLAYFVVFNSKRYHNYRDEYVARLNKDTLNYNATYALYSDNVVLQLKNYYQRNLEFTYIIAGLVYLLNIIDASVYAHLFSFDVGNDLALDIRPALNSNPFRLDMPPSAGLQLTLRFK